jgi:hypothetical protein
MEEKDEQTPEETNALSKEDLLPRTEDELPIPLSLRHSTQALFYEYRHQTTSKVQAPYTLKDYDVHIGGKTYRSMYMVYMSCDSEYEAAIKLLGSYGHWKKLVAAKWFADYYARWEYERNVRDEALARSVVVKLAEKGNVTAARTLFQNSKTHNPGEPGRPAKGGKRKEGSGSAELDEMLSRASEG